ncbi:hypothetical protein LCGC14_2361140, partial [marine sediment metagenome]
YMSKPIKLTGNNFPQPPPICFTKETKRCPHCNSGRKEGFDIVIDKTLILGVACLCWICGFSC